MPVLVRQYYKIQFLERNSLVLDPFVNVSTVKTLLNSVKIEMIGLRQLKIQCNSKKKVPTTNAEFILIQFSLVTCI